MSDETKPLPRFLENSFLAAQPDKIRPVAIKNIKPYSRALRKHPEAQKTAMEGNLGRFGQALPVPITHDHVVIDGHLVVEALKRLGATHVLAIYVDHLSDAEIKALRIALNKLGEATDWEDEQLVIELAEIVEAGIELEIIGSDSIEFDVLSDRFAAPGDDEDDAEPPLPPDYEPVSRPGDVWILGEHRLVCGDATDPETYQKLLGAERVRMVFTDPPYNVRINGHVKRKA